MCGLFGLIRNQLCDPSPASETLLALGVLAEERGTHAAGLAMATGGAPGAADGAAGNTAPPVNALPDLTANGWRVVKGDGVFRGVWRPALRTPLDRAPAVLGHTRFATQGAVGRFPNSSPLRVGRIIGTHNGDIDVPRLRDRFPLRDPAGQTDTEVLLQALDQARGAIRPTLEVLAAAVGRTALAWTDRRRPHTVTLARTALSPLSFTFDGLGNLYWASNPAWFTAAARQSGVEMDPDRVVRMPEGSLVLLDHAGGRPRIAQWHRFRATARHLDEELAPRVAYLGFSPADRTADRLLADHATVSDTVTPVSARGVPVPAAD